MNIEKTRALIKEKQEEGLMHYVYALLLPCRTPFYIGKGSKERCISHYEKGKNNRRKGEVVNKLREAGTPHIIDILSFHRSADNAFNREREIIKEMGREHDGGILTNITKGGKTNTYPITEETRKKMSMSHIGHKQPQSQIDKRMSASYFGSERHSEVARKICKARWSKDGAREHASETMKRICKDKAEDWKYRASLRVIIFQIQNKIYLGTHAARAALGGIGQGTLYTRIAQGVVQRLGTVGTHPHLIPNT